MQALFVRHGSNIVRLLPRGLIGLMILLCIGMFYFAYQWQLTKQQNQFFLKQKVQLTAIESEDPKTALHRAYLLGQQPLKSDTIKQLMHALAIAETAQNPVHRAQAKFAEGNLYFDLSKLSADIKAGGAHQQAVAQIALAREAYKAAIRLDADLHAAKFNLELLDRLSPQKRTQAWLAETDGVTLQPFKRNGTAMMKDNQRRGLP